MSTIVVAISERVSTSSKLVLHLTLGRRRVYRVPRTPCRLRVLAGAAWVTFDGEDNVVWAGRSIDLESPEYGALVSAIGEEDLVVEVSTRTGVAYDQFMRGLAEISAGQPRGLAVLTRRSARR